MGKLKFYFSALAMLLTGLLAACSDNSSVNNEPEAPVDTKSKVYMNIDITSTASAGTRSSTNEDGSSTDGTEVGQDHENKISSIMVLLVGRDPENKENSCFIAKWTKRFGVSEDISGEGKSITADFNRSSLLDHYAKHGEGDETWAQNVAVYVICNYTEEISAKVGTPGDTGSLEWLNSVLSTDGMTKGDIPYWKNNNFLMTNYSTYLSTIPSKEELDQHKYATSKDLFDLTEDTPIAVERAVARLDYAAAIEDPTYKGVKDSENNYYYVFSEKTDAQPEIRMYLKRMSLVNVSKQFYLFRRVSSNGLPTGENFAIGGKETNKNYVIDPEYAFKSNIAGKSSNEYLKRFHYWVNNVNINEGNLVNTTWDSYNISDVISKTKYDNIYSFWRYITPNTIPDANNQYAGISTGVVFKAQIVADDYTKGVGLRMANHDDLFAYTKNGKNILIGSWADVRATATNGTDGDIQEAYNNAIAKESSLNADLQKLTTPDQIKAAVEEGGFTRYRYGNGGDGVGEGYFCNYYYWNRHNDNGDSGKMGPMEFGVVRNNVYKLCVTSIQRLGHPIDPNNDPDPVDPEDPDEESKLYMTVSVKVRPWTKRVNHIDF